MIPEVWKHQVGDWALHKRSIAAVWVFGSYARGTQREDSDLDLAVLLRAHDGEDLAEWIFNGKAWQAELTRLLGVTVDLDIANPDISDGIVGPTVKREGVLIYGELTVAQRAISAKSRAR